MLVLDILIAVDDALEMTLMMTVTMMTIRLKLLSSRHLVPHSQRKDLSWEDAWRLGFCMFSVRRTVRPSLAHGGFRSIDRT